MAVSSVRDRNAAEEEDDEVIADTEELAGDTTRFFELLAGTSSPLRGRLPPDLAFGAKKDVIMFLNS